MASTAPITRFTVPDIASYTSTVFSYKRNPHHSEVEAASQTWFDSYGIHLGVKREIFFGSQFCLLASLFYPDAGLEHVRLAMDFILWLYTFDNMADTGELTTESLKRQVDITISALLPDAPVSELKIAAASQSFVNRMRANGNHRVVQHFIASLDNYYQAIIKEKLKATEGSVENIDEYIENRRGTSAIRQIFAMLEYAHCLNITDEDRHNIIVVGLSDAANDIVSWTNDIYSFPVERSHKQLHNFVYVVMHNNKIGLQEAVDYIHQRIRARVKEYGVLKAQLYSFGPSLDIQIAKYVQGIEYVVQGCIEWHFITPRYFGRNGLEVRKDGVVELETAFTAVVL